MERPIELYPELVNSLYEMQDAVVDDLEKYLRSIGVPQEIVELIEFIRGADVDLNSSIDELDPTEKFRLEHFLNDNLQSMAAARILLAHPPVDPFRSGSGSMNLRLDDPGRMS